MLGVNGGSNEASRLSRNGAVSANTTAQWRQNLQLLHFPKEERISVYSFRASVAAHWGLEMGFWKKKTVRAQSQLLTVLANYSSAPEFLVVLLLVFVGVSFFLF